MQWLGKAPKPGGLVKYVVGPYFCLTHFIDLGTMRMISYYRDALWLARLEVTLPGGRGQRI